MRMFDDVKKIILFLLTGMFTSVYATELNTTIKKSGYYEIEAVLEKEMADKNFTLTAGDGKTYTGFLREKDGRAIIPLGFLPSGKKLDVRSKTPATFSVIEKEVKTVKSAKLNLKIGQTVLHEIKQPGFYSLANTVLTYKNSHVWTDPGIRGDW